MGELITSRGLITGQTGRSVLGLARELAGNPRIDALSITDNPGGNAMLSPDTVGTDLIHRGQEVIIHERGPRPIGKSLHVIERAGKSSMFGCRDCGDCSLPDVAYLCPESQCAKNQRNGPCGGTRDGACEVGEKECIWALAYERLKKYGEEETMLEGPVVIKDNALRGTSAWANAFLGRDHTAKRPESSGAGSRQ